jgi:hypothetical protein
MIEREPFLIRHMVRIFAVLAAVGLIALVIFGVRFQSENAEYASATRGASHQYKSRPPIASELADSCEFFGGVYLGAPAKTVGTVGLLESCNLVGTAVQRIQCEFFDGTWRKADCSVDVTAALQAQR